MTNEQQERLLDFIGNFVALMQQKGHSRDCVYDAACAAVACLFATVWELYPDAHADEIGTFVSSVIEAALLKFYGSEKVGLQA